MTESNAERGARQQAGCQPQQVRRFVQGPESEVDQETVEAIDAKRENTHRQNGEHGPRGNPCGSQAAGGNQPDQCCHRPDIDSCHAGVHGKCRAANL
jgi:hypothetical protein